MLILSSKYYCEPLLYPVFRTAFLPTLFSWNLTASHSVNGWRGKAYPLVGPPHSGAMLLRQQQSISRQCFSYEASNRRPGQ